MVNALLLRSFESFLWWMLCHRYLWKPVSCVFGWMLLPPWFWFLGYRFRWWLMFHRLS
jgi:hypothetical protein